MNELGAKLIQAREAAGLSLEDLFEKTKIQVKLLKALEEEKFDAFPGEVYVKGALRNYAEAVGVQYEEVSALYRESKGPEGEKETAPVQKIEREPIEILRPPRKSINMKPFLILVAIALIAAALVYLIGLFLDSGSLPGTPPANGPSTDQPADDDDTDPDAEPEPEDPVVAISLLKPDPAKEEFILVGAEEMRVEILFNGDCWIRIWEDGDVIKSGTFRKGQSHIFSSAKSVRIRLGNSRGVQAITVNGLNLETTNRNTSFNVDISLEGS